MPKLTRTIVVMATGLWGACFAYANTTSGATASVVPNSGISATNIASPQSSCTGQLWSCIADPVGYPDLDGSYIYTVNPNSPASHVIGFTSSYSQITSVTMHIVAAGYNGGSGTVTMSFYNGSQLAGQGGAKTVSSSTYSEYVSGIFYTSVANLGDITMKIALTGSVKYTAVWLDITYGTSGHSSGNLLPFLNNGNTAWSSGYCTDPGCAGGKGLDETVSITDGVSVPSGGPYPTGSSIAVSTTDPTIGNTDSALEWVKQASNSNPAPPSSLFSLTGDWWVYPTNESSNDPRTLEFDTFWANGSQKAMWGSHCSLHDSNSNGQVWYVDSQDGQGWMPIYDSMTGKTIPCTLTPNQWHHVTWQVHVDLNAGGGGGNLGRLYYDYLTVDGTTYNLDYHSKTHALPSSTWVTLGIQAQQDLNAQPPKASITEYLDVMSFTYWQ